MQELLAGVGVAVAVALVFAVTVASNGVTSSANNVVRAVIGPADLQLRARGPNGFDEHLITQVERLPGVVHAGLFLEQAATIVGPDGRLVAVTVAGASVRLAVMDGLSHTLPSGVLSEGIGLSEASASALGITRPSAVTVDLRGRAIRLDVSAILGHETAGALSTAQIAITPLFRLQELAGLPHRVSRILIQSQPGHEATVRAELDRLTGGHLTVAAANQDVSLLREALRPSNQASELFAGLSALLGFLFAFNAMLLTVPERREAIADLRLDGTPRTAIVQMVLFEALCLGLAACLIGLLGGYALSIGLFHPSVAYLAQTFTLGTSTKIGAQPVALSVAGGVLATCLASLVLLQDLRRGHPLDAVFARADDGGGLPANARRWLAMTTVSLVVLTSGLFILVPSAALIACVVLALATILAVPLVFGIVLRVCDALASVNPNFTVLPLALSSLKSTTLRSLALAATGAVALFGSIALGGARDDLLRGLHSFASADAADASIWVTNPRDTAAANNFRPGHYPSRISRISGVASVHVFQSEFMTIGQRRVWIIARPTSTSIRLLNSQIVEGNAATAAQHLRQEGWITVSKQIAEERHVRPGGVLDLPTPTGTIKFKLAATTTNFGWTSGVVMMSINDYTRFWATSEPSALGINLTKSTPIGLALREIGIALGTKSGLEAITAHARADRFDAIAGEGLQQLDEISTLLVATAILAMAAALGSSIWQRRQSLAELRLEGAPRPQLQLVLLVESTLMLSAGCLSGAIAGIYGQVVIDGYLKHVTGFPVAGVATGQRPIEIFALVIIAVLLIVSLPGWFASGVPATLALNE
ncbi:MAG TPA: FtsX-like permease family protein [Solirubrobacteraceae bacterium]|jgi:putative ABC transport system permease protein|nr:FtsX-like permease family protein [Solirubrobacteraceae bacterium]